MARCPNCERETERTKDWACRWCGYPLSSGSHRKIDKTYKQLKDEGLAVRVEVEEAVAEAEAEPEAAAKPEAEPEAEEVEEAEAEAEAEKEEVEEAEPEAEAEEVAEAGAEAEAVEEAGEVISITAAGLLAAYEKEGLAADKRFTNEVLKVTGIVAKIVANEIINRYEIALSGGEEHQLGDIQCTFDESHAAELNQMETGQTVTVQGQYGGFVTNILIKDCKVVN